MTYLELEKLCKNCNDEVCLFGAGEIGKLYAYELLNLAGLTIDFYCDNKVAPGTVIRDGIEVRDIQYLYKNKSNIQVFLTATYRYQKPIIEQLKEKGIHNVIVADYLFFSQVLDSIEASGDELVRQRYHQIYDNQKFLERIFEAKTGYKLNINNPETFNEKLQWLKLYDRNPEYTRMVDKYEVKQFVEERIGNEYVIPTLDVWNSFDEIDFDKLPDQFVLKCTHDSGSIVIVEDKENFNQEEAKRTLSAALQVNYFWIGREWPYKNVNRRIIAEEYMAEQSQMIDYKFLCFDGIPRILFTCTERVGSDGLKVTFFDLDWNQLDFERHYSSSKKKIKRPYNLELMIKLSEKLSVGIPFVRVDFYEIKGQVYFGEMTFFPGSGYEEFSPDIWDKKLGDWITLPQ